MKRTVLDLIQEYAVLNQEKTLGGGRLPPDKEARWAELKDFYDVVMEQDGLASQPVVRVSAFEIREKVRTRSQLRVMTELEIVVEEKDKGEYYPARIGNLSCGGALFYCGHRFETGTELTLQLANIARGRETWPTESVVVWSANGGPPASTFTYRHGVQFAKLGSDEIRNLDRFVVDSLEAKLLSLRRDALDPDFIHREQLAL